MHELLCLALIADMYCMPEVYSMLEAKLFEVLKLEDYVEIFIATKDFGLSLAEKARTIMLKHLKASARTRTQSFQEIEAEDLAALLCDESLSWDVNTIEVLSWWGQAPNNTAASVKWQTQVRDYLGSDGWSNLRHDSVRRYSGHESPVICMFEDKNMLYTSSVDGQLFAWDKSTMEAKVMLKKKNSPTVTTCMDAIQGLLLFGECSKIKGQIHMYDSEITKRVGPEIYLGSIVHALPTCEDSLVVSASGDKKLTIWELNVRDGAYNMKRKNEFEHDDAVLCLAIVSKIIISGSADETIRLFDLNGALIQQVKPELGWVRAFAQKENSLICSCDNAVLIFESESKSE